MTLWETRAIHQFTDSNGYTGFGLGTGSYIKDVAEGGPHTIWVLSPSLSSDGLTGVGMLGGTNHRGPLSLVFQIDRDDFATLDEAIIHTAKASQRMAHNFEAAIQRKALANGHWLVGDEVDVTWRGDWRGVTQLAVDPRLGREYAYFASNLSGEWSVDVKPLP